MKSDESSVDLNSSVTGHLSLWQASGATHRSWFTLHGYGVMSLMTLFCVIWTAKQSTAGLRVYMVRQLGKHVGATVSIHALLFQVSL